jgi:SAM-dependent methyltransferase
MMDPLAGSPWSAPDTVAGFAASPPNEVLMRFAGIEAAHAEGRRAIDIGCGAGRNAVPLAQQGWHVLGTDWSSPMLSAAAARADDVGVARRLRLALAPMDDLPAANGGYDLVVAHGIWNLARSAAEFRRAVAEAARVARAGAGLFVFTFSRHTLPAEARPVPGEPFVFTQFSGEPQCFVTSEQLLFELASAGFTLDPAVPLSEHNRPSVGGLHVGQTPVIYEAAFRRA